ncbi:MAG TPA: hypothetical protein VKT32_14665 [Chthonomonadaceae bacterium]|nr:hypothetical protein [Chthonomonadaceae bacterium]
MTLAQVQAAALLVAALIGSWAGLMMAVALLMPFHTQKAERALEIAPRRCFLGGLPMLFVFFIAILLLRAPNPGAKLLGFLVALGIGAALVVGAAGLARLMGKRIGEMSGAKTSFGMLVWGSLVFSGALFFPLLGWWLFTPVSALFALGAGMTALWPARRIPTPQPTTVLEHQGAV